MEAADYSEMSGLTYQTAHRCLSEDSNVTAMYVLMCSPKMWY